MQMNDQRAPEPAQHGFGRELADERVDLRRYLDALRRGRYLIAAIVVVVTVVVVGVSLLLASTYEAEATLLLDEPQSELLATDAESVERRLATFGTLIGSRAVSERAAEEVAGPSADEISDAVSSSVEEEANLITVRAEDGEPEVAAEIANAVAAAFIDEQREVDRQEARDAIAELEEELDRVESEGGSDEEEQAIRELIDDLTVQSVNPDLGLRIAEEAEAPESAVSPKPLRNGVLALVASLLLGVVAALVRDQLRGRVDDARQLARLVGLPVLVEVPYVRGRRARSGAVGRPEREAYRTLATELRLTLADSGHDTIVVTSALIGEGKTTVTARLGLALAEAGQAPLLVSGDLRRPRLHELFGLAAEPGLSDALRRAERGGVSERMLAATAQTVQLPTPEGTGQVGLDVLTAGTAVGNPARLLSGPTAHELFEQAADGGYRYVLIDAPPLLGQADVQALARVADHVLIVARPDLLGLEVVEDMQGALRRLGVEPLGLVVIGRRLGPGYYGPDGGSFGDEATDAAWQSGSAGGQGAPVPGGWVRGGMGPRR